MEQLSSLAVLFESHALVMLLMSVHEREGRQTAWFNGNKDLRPIPHYPTNQRRHQASSFWTSGPRSIAGGSRSNGKWAIALEIWADIFKDGHDKIAARIEYWREGESEVSSTEMMLADNDRWTGFFHVASPGRYRYRIVADPDAAATKRDEIVKKFDAGIDVSLGVGNSIRSLRK